MQQPEINNIDLQTLIGCGLSETNLVREKDLKAWEQNELSVGKYYTICYALIQRIYSDTKMLIPVHPFLHADKQFSPAPAHYHIDGRFMSKDLSYRLGMSENKRTNTAVFMNKNDGQPYDFKIFLNIFYGRARCNTLFTGLDIMDLGNHSLPRALNNWFRSMEGKSCAGKKCPHYGVNMIDRGTHLFCPMHNLVGCKTTNKILPYEQGFALENASAEAIANSRRKRITATT